jgi:hypothetical protein
VNSGVICGAVAQHKKGEETDERDGNGAHRGNARRAERFGKLQQTLH